MKSGADAQAGASTSGHRFRLAAAVGAVALVLLAIGGVATQLPARGSVTQLTLAVIGDYGCLSRSCGAVNTQQEAAVANLVHSWNPNYIVTVGDNSYENGSSAEVPADQQPYAADVQAGRFLPIAGNHDWGNTCNPAAINASTSYFGRPPHYTAHLGNGLLDLFATDMNCGDPDGDNATSRQAALYRAEVVASTAIWKVTASHQPFYSSGQHGTQAYTHWAILPQIDLFLSGHDHDWEHLNVGGQNFVVDGVGGRNVRTGTTCLRACVPGSLWHDDQHYGAVRLTITTTQLLVEYINLSGAVEHSFTLTKGPSSSATPTPTVTPTPTATSSVTPQPGSGLRAAFYYPWFPEAWKQQGMDPFTKYHPSAGFYGLDGAGVVKQQIAAMQYANIQVGISSWWGQGTPTDRRVPRLLAGAAGTGFRWALYYEQEGVSDPSVSQIRSDLTYIKSRYASDSSYLKLGGKFVVFVFADSRDNCGMANRWKQANTMGAYVVLKVFPGYRKCSGQPQGWHQYSPAVATDAQAGYSFSISPGFNKANERAARLARDLNRWNADIRRMIASKAPFQLIATFNEWGEGTAVESATEWATASGFGAYLDALHNNGGLGPGASPSPTSSPTPSPTATPSPSPSPSGSLPDFRHVFVIVMENKEYGSIIGNSAAPYINALASQYGLATEAYAIRHPSLPNYLGLTAGSTFGITSDCTNCFVNSTNLADQIEASGRSWKAYMEGMPSACFAGSSYPYAQKHDPWIYYDNIRTDAARCTAHIVPFTQFDTDIASGNVPDFSWITPNMCNDMHDCSVATGDRWLSQQVPTILSSQAFLNGGVLVITWDEGSTSAGCCTNAAGGHIATLVISPLGKPHVRSTVPETHYSVLRMIEDAWGLPPLNGAACTCVADMREYFK